MKRQLLKNSSVLFAAVIVFVLMSGVALAQKKHWFVVKDVNGVCRVIEAKEKTPATIAGPFKTMEAAEKRKAKVCPKGAGQATEQLRPQREQSEPMRRQHQQREEPQQKQLKQEQQPQQQQQTEKSKGKTQEKIEGAKPSQEKVKEKTKEPIPESDKKN